MMRRVATMLITMGMVLGGSTLFLSTPGGASTTGTGTGITYTLEGCRASTSAYIAPGTYICPDANYTTGNLGKGWNEFDLVPGRVTLAAGTSAPATQNYSFVIAVDNCSTGDGQTGCASGRPGFDRLSSDSGSVPTINTNLSSTSGCGTIAASAATYAPPTGSAIGGTGTSLYRTITITGQATGTTCVYDFFARLAFNSHLYPGSSLHFDLANSDLGTAGIGAKDVSIPVSAILPPGFTKSQTSSQGSSAVWSVSKAATPTSFDFLNTCSTAEGATSKAVSVTVTWTKSTSSAGAITVVGHISLTNNAHRTIDVSVSDQLFKDATWTTAYGSPIITTTALAAGASYSFDDTFSVPSGTATAFSDTATATFTDPVFDDTLGTGTQQAKSNVVTVASTSGATASIKDVEQMTGSTDFNFSVDSVTSGTFEGGYTPTTKTRGPVTWDSGLLSASGSATFGKTIYVLHPNTGTATLGDTATLTPDGQEATTGSASTVVNGNAIVSIVISKTMDKTFDTDKTFTFNATGSDHSTGSTTIVIKAGQEGPATGTISGLNPGVSYSIDEPAVAPFPEQTTSAVVNLPSCSTTVNVVNTAPTTTSTTSTTIPNFVIPTTTTTLPTTTTVPPTTVPPTTSTTVGAQVLPEQGSTTVAPTTAAPTTIPTAVLPVTGSRTLPFTGRNFQWLILAALALILLGLALLAEGRRTPSARTWE